MATDTKQNLHQQLWSTAETMRGKIGAEDFRDYIPGFIFYKYLSENGHTRPFGVAAGVPCQTALFLPAATRWCFSAFENTPVLREAT